MLTPWWKSLRWRLGAVLAGFVLCLGAMGGTMVLALQTQRVDNARLAVAGHQRLLLHQLAWQTLAQPTAPTLPETQATFEQTLFALRNGGPVQTEPQQWLTLPPAPATLQAPLDAIIQRWQTARPALQAAEVAALDAQLVTLTNALETETQNHQRGWQGLQFGFFVAALVLLSGVLVLIWRRIVTPLAQLNVSAQRLVAGEAGTRPWPATPGANDLGELSQAFETLRAEVTTAREQLEGQVTQRTRELTAVFEISQEMVTQQQPEQLLQSVANHARTLTQAEAVSVCLLNPHQTELIMAARAGGVDHPSLARHTLDEDPALRVINHNETVTAEAACTRCSFLQAHGPGPCIAAPLRAGAVTLGALCAVRAPAHPFDPHEARAFTLLANSAAVALTNARLLKSVQQQAKDKAALAEREHLSAELHDHVAQTLGFMRLKVENLQALYAAGRAAEADADWARLRNALEMVYGQVRSVLTGLREAPAPTSPLGLRLAQCVAEFQELTGMLATVTGHEADDLTLTPLAQTQVLHITREALTNIRRHAQARHVSVCVQRVAGQVSFTIQDDGVGFDPTQAAGEHHLGLNIMRARAERSGGRLIIASQPGQGTTVTTWFPSAPPQ